MLAAVAWSLLLSLEYGKVTILSRMSATGEALDDFDHKPSTPRCWLLDCNVSILANVRILCRMS